MKEDMLRVNEIFYSLQGEGVFAGTPTTFLRLQGCNLRCDFCDTPAALNKTGGTDMTIDAILEEMARRLTKTNHLCVTGGEPMLQQDELVKMLSKMYTHTVITVETNGSIKPIDYWRNLGTVIFMISPKDLSKPPIQYPQAAFYKFVFDDNLDEIVDYIETYHISATQVFLMPKTTFRARADKRMARRCMGACLKTGLRFSPRIHIEYGLK